MSFFAILLALLIEQARPLARSNLVHTGMRSWTHWIGGNFDAGQSYHGGLAWGLTVLLPALLAFGVHWALTRWLGWPFAMCWSVAILYVTLGFRQFSHFFTDIRDALDAGDEARARAVLAQWQQADASELPRSELVRYAIEYSVLAAHRHVFGVLAWFSVLAALGLGPAGAVIYRMSEFVTRDWPQPSPDQPEQRTSAALHDAARRAWVAVDWLPARVTALGFAVVGSFEEAIESWRQYARRFPDDNDGVILAATAGAVNVRLGGQALQPAEDEPAPLDSESPPGREPEAGHLRSIVGLVWRSVVLWMLLLALLTLARLLG